MSQAIVTFGETMALMAPPHVGRLHANAELRLGVGGAESNFAIGVARLGREAHWVGRVGDDALGDLIERELRGERVCTHVIRDSAATGLMVKERRTAATTSVNYYRRDSAGSHLHDGDIPVELIRHASFLHVTGITLAISDSAAAAVHHAVATARAAQVSVSFDINHRSRLWETDRARTALLALLPSTDIVFAGTDEAALLLGADVDDPVEAARAIAAYGPTTVIIKLGAAGAVALIDDDVYTVEPVPIDAVDTVGAGDAFAAGFIADLDAGASAETALRTAAQAGAFACLAHGDWEGLPTRRDLALLMSDADPVAR